jgi:hypothetical protein
MSELCAISKAFLYVSTFAVGILSGIIGSIAFYKWKFRRSGIEDFAQGVKEEIVALSLAADNIDQSLVNLHVESCRRLEAFAMVLMNSDPKAWKCVEKAYDAYTFKEKEKAFHNYIKFDKDGVDGRRGLMLLLSELLHETRKV